MIDKDVPGPGKYDCLKAFGSDSNKFTMATKPESKAYGNKNTVPGPGQYPVIIQTNIDGKCPLSQFKNATKIVFGADKTTRFKYESNFF
jgi:hypothetical protein